MSDEPEKLTPWESCGKHVLTRIKALQTQVNNLTRRVFRLEKSVELLESEEGID